MHNKSKGWRTYTKVQPDLDSGKNDAAHLHAFVMHECGRMGTSWHAEQHMSQPQEEGAHWRGVCMFARDQYIHHWDVKR